MRTDFFHFSYSLSALRQSWLVGLNSCSMVQAQEKIPLTSYVLYYYNHYDNQSNPLLAFLLPDFFARGQEFLKAI
jgi:hypothetical protein